MSKLMFFVVVPLVEQLNLLAIKRYSGFFFCLTPSFFECAGEQIKLFTE
jgi:hypothetical protein